MFAGGAAQLVDDLGVVVGVDLQQVAGGFGGAAAGAGDGPGGLSVQGGAGGRGDGLVDGGGDERVDELQGVVGAGEDAGLAQQAGTVGGVLLPSPVSSAASRRVMLVPRTAADQASLVASVPSPSRVATRPRPRALALSSRRAAAVDSTGSIPAAPTLARSSTVSYGLPPVTAQTSRQNGSSAPSPRVARVRRRWRRG
ncbi:hypothetical protein ACFQVA_36800 [Actinomadura keratinilytica]